MASVVHRQETVDCLRKFNARRKLKVRLCELKCNLYTIISEPVSTNLYENSACVQCCRLYSESGVHNELGTKREREGSII